MIELVETLGPSIITIFGGALMATVLVPRIQRQFNRNKLLAERQLDLSEQIVDAFSRYIVAWDRLINLSAALGEQLSDEQKSMRAGFVSDRNKHREDLLALLYKSKLYFSGDVSQLMDEFIEWDRKQVVRTIDDLPSINVWWDRFNNLTRALSLDSP